MSSPPPPPPPPSSSSYNSSILVIITLLAFVFIFTIIIHLILRLLARLSSAPPSSPYISRRRPDSISSSSSSSSTSGLINTNRMKSLIDSLPLFTPSSLSLPPSANCTICLSNFASNDKIRLLPACRHTFHPLCIDAWLKTSPSCPLCRSTVRIQPLSREEVISDVDQESVRISWLKEYVDRLALSSAPSSFRSTRSTPFGSMRFSSSWGRSRRFDGEISGGLELGDSFRSEESGYLASTYKWMMNEGATS